MSFFSFIPVVGKPSPSSGSSGKIEGKFFLYQFSDVVYIYNSSSKLEL